MAVSEGQRQAYLRELGIHVYFPRRPLPGAKPSARYGGVALQAPGRSMQSAHPGVHILSTLVDTPSSVQAPGADRPAMTASRLAAPSAPRPAVAPLAPVASASPAVPVVPAEEARFVFAYFPINEELAVINELPWAKSAAVSPTCRQLLAAILRALSLPVEEKTLTSMVFTWPLEEGPDADRSAQSARHMLDGFMARRFKLRPVRYLLVLAEQSAGYLFPADHDWQQEGMISHPQHGVKVVVTRSLNAMEAVPELKRSVWQALQPLRAALAGGVGNGQ